MAAPYLTPGVHVEEVPSGARPIAAVGTSTAAFVGVAPDGGAHVNEPVACNNLSEFFREFVGDRKTATPLVAAVTGFFQNGGGRCYVVNIGKDGNLVGDPKKRTGMYALEPVDEVAIVAAPGFTDAGSYEAVLSHCERLKDRVAVLDAPEEVADIDGLVKVASASSGGEGEGGQKKGALRPRNSDGGFGAFYFPWILVNDPLDPSKTMAAPPSGHMAGIYARTDSTRGVHKAPANETVRGALGVKYQLTREEQGKLNPAGVNCIRFFQGAGTRIWGARTLAEEAGPWRYLNVRRLFNMIEESIEEGTRWTVFEPNDQVLWKAIERDVRAFLTLQWRAGALMGATPEQAFFVKCDAETNPKEVVDAGRVVTEVGIAPVKPAEFVVFRISQWAGGAEVEA